jgi:hypothetical protein
VRRQPEPDGRRLGRQQHHGDACGGAEQQQGRLAQDRQVSSKR